MKVILPQGRGREPLRLVDSSQNENFAKGTVRSTGTDRACQALSAWRDEDSRRRARGAAPREVSGSDIARFETRALCGQRTRGEWRLRAAEGAKPDFPGRSAADHRRATGAVRGRRVIAA